MDGPWPYSDEEADRRQNRDSRDGRDVGIGGLDFWVPFGLAILLLAGIALGVVLLVRK